MQLTSLYAIENCLQGLEEIASGGEYSPKFLKPFHLVTMKLLTIKSKIDPTNIKLKDQNMTAYASIMHLEKKEVLAQQEALIKTEDRFLPIVHFNSSKDGDLVLDKLKFIFQRLSQKSQDSLDNCFLELINNFSDHANADDTLPGLIAVQTWPAGNLLQVAIADAGIGIRKSLSLNQNLAAKLSVENACQLASGYGVSSRPNNNHSGYGLALAKDLMKQANGSYILVSGDEVYRVSKKEHTQNLKNKWNGTILILEWPLDAELDSTRIYDSWPEPEWDNDDEYF